MPNQKNNPCNRQNFNSACALLAHAAPQNTFNVQNIWMDYGAGMMWETIICTRPDGSSYQVLNPRDWDRLQSADLLEEVEGIVADIIESQRRLLGSLNPRRTPQSARQSVARCIDCSKARSPMTT